MDDGNRAGGYLVSRHRRFLTTGDSFRRTAGAASVVPCDGLGRMDSNPRPPRCAVIGAGMAGILSAIKLTEAGLTDFTVYERADRVGGTWRDNTYPGLSCDVPSHLYSYSFALSPEWSRHFSPVPRSADTSRRSPKSTVSSNTSGSVTR